MSVAADGAPAQWRCSTPITVRLAGVVPSGADTALAGTVESLTAATGLPLAIGDPLPDAVVRRAVSANEIVVGYVPRGTLEAAGDDVTDDTLGVGCGQSDDSGNITNGWIGILADDPAMVQVGEVAPQGGRYVRLQDFAGPQTAESVPRHLRLPTCFGVVVPEQDQLGLPRAGPRPRHMRHHHPMLAAGHPRGVGLHHRLHRD